MDVYTLLMFHAKDDPNVPHERTRRFAEITGSKLRTLKRGGHISTEYIVRKYWAKIKASSIRLAFHSVNKLFRLFCYPCIPIE